MATLMAFAPTTTAANTVFNIVEILEMILLHLPIQDLLLLQRTSKIWQATIQRSKSIQTNLYLRSSSMPLTAWIQAKSTPPVIRHLSARNTPPHQIKRLGPISDVQEIETFAVTASFNELIVQRPRFGKTHLTRRICFGEQMQIQRHIRDSFFSHDNELKCDNMFLTDPPAKSLAVSWRCKPECSGPSEGTFGHSAKVVNLEGVRVRDLRRAVRQECRGSSCDGNMNVSFRRQTRLGIMGLLFPMKEDFEEAGRVMG